MPKVAKPKASQMLTSLKGRSKTAENEVQQLEKKAQNQIDKTFLTNKILLD